MFTHPTLPNGVISPHSLIPLESIWTCKKTQIWRELSRKIINGTEKKWDKIKINKITANSKACMWINVSHFTTKLVALTRLITGSILAYECTFERLMISTGQVSESASRPSPLMLLWSQLQSWNCAHWNCATSNHCAIVHGKQLPLGMVWREVFAVPYKYNGSYWAEYISFASQIDDNPCSKGICFVVSQGDC